MLFSKEKISHLFILAREKTKDVWQRLKPHFAKPRKLPLLPIAVMILSLAIFASGVLMAGFYPDAVKNCLDKLKINLPVFTRKTLEKETIIKEYVPQTTQEQAIINVVKDASPAVVSIIITKDLPVYEQYYTMPFDDFFGFQLQVPQLRQKGTQKQEVGGGSGFIVSKDGLILTNKHVVLDTEAEYTVLTNDGKKFIAKVLARDSFQDLAIIKIEPEIIDSVQKDFPVVKLGDSSKIEIGQTVIAIGNALGEFRNTVSVGVISGLSRTITASGGGLAETLDDVIQTDAAINPGNSGGPLLNLRGEVIGINTAIVQDAQNIGFTIPINQAKRDIQQVKSTGKIVYPFLGVRYILVTQDVQQKNNLSVDYGALVAKGSANEAAVYPGSAAEKAGLKEGDVILEFGDQKVDLDNSLAKLIMAHNPGESVKLKILRQGKELFVNVVLGEKE
ncbi:MAG: trypsin-like peptidase domain-containing protein [bacterium]|nr:trypsin-like peptidase domain-containing protein [bacterium]